MAENEVNRIQRVYAGYRNEEFQARWSSDNPGNRAIAKERSVVLEFLLREAGFLPLIGCRILDVGCGSGGILASFQEWGAQSADLYGIDLLKERIDAARASHPGLHFKQANAEQLPFENASFDLVLLFTVFTSIIDADMAANVASEVKRVMKPKGAVVWYDFRYNNPQNPHVRGVSIEKIQEWFPGFEVRLRCLTLLPPLARRLGRLTPWLYPVLAKLVPLRTHYAGLLLHP